MRANARRKGQGVKRKSAKVKKEKGEKNKRAKGDMDVCEDCEGTRANGEYKLARRARKKIGQRMRKNALQTELWVQ